MIIVMTLLDLISSFITTVMAPGTSKCQSMDTGEKISETTSKWKNRERLLVMCSRGAAYRTRHLMNDFKRLMPHLKSENKFEKCERLTTINELSEIANCTKCLYFEERKLRICKRERDREDKYFDSVAKTLSSSSNLKIQDVYLWMSDITDGPSIKFLVHNIHTMDELRMSGNCLQGSRPILSFDAAFNAQSHLLLIKHMLTQIFSTPDHHPRSQPFIDHVFSFSLSKDGKIWFRNFQIVNESLQLQEIGPRMVLELIRIFDGSFEGSVLYDNPSYIAPNTIRRNMKKKGSEKYMQRKLATAGRKEYVKKLEEVPVPDPVGNIYETDREITNSEAKRVKRTIEKGSLKKRKAKTKILRKYLRMGDSVMTSFL